MHWIDPDHLPETTGVVDCFLLNGEGEADGLVLKDGTEVHFPPHMGSEEGARMVDAGPPDDDEGRKAGRKQTHAKRTVMEAQGVVRQLLHGPKGEVRGVMLEDGRSGRFPPHAAQGLAAMLVPNASVLLRGEGLVTPHGTIIAVREVGTSADDLRPVEAKKPEDKHKDHKPHRPGPREGNPGAGHPL